MSYFYIFFSIFNVALIYLLEKFLLTTAWCPLTPLLGNSIRADLAPKVLLAQFTK